MQDYAGNKYTSDDFKLWQQRDKKFHFKKEIIDYCIQNVVILRKGCLKFQEIIGDLTKMESEDLDDNDEAFSFPPILPFEKNIIASLAMHIFRSKFLWETCEVKTEMGNYTRLAIRVACIIWRVKRQSGNQQIKY